jgi:hypothetical protein
VLLFSNIRKFTDRSWQERWLFVEAYLLLGIFRLLIITLPFKRIVWMLKLSAGEGRTAFKTGAPLYLSAASWAIQAAASRTPWESVCLGQALTGIVMLRLRGFSATLYLGIAKDITGSDPLAAHAWLRSGDFFLTGADGHERYAIISEYSSN